MGIVGGAALRTFFGDLTGVYFNQRQKSFLLWHSVRFFSVGMRVSVVSDIAFSIFSSSLKEKRFEELASIMDVESRLEDVESRLEKEVESALRCCLFCKNYSFNPYLKCAVNPSLPPDCPDFEARSD